MERGLQLKPRPDNSGRGFLVGIARCIGSLNPATKMSKVRAHSVPDGRPEEFNPHYPQPFVTNTASPSATAPQGGSPLNCSSRYRDIGDHCKQSGRQTQRTPKAGSISAPRFVEVTVGVKVVLLVEPLAVESSGDPDRGDSDRLERSSF